MTQNAISAEQAEEGGRDPKTVILAGVLAAAVLGAGAFFFLGGSSDGSVADAAAPTITRTVAKTKPSPLPAPAAMPAPATVVGGKNPFKVLYTAPVAKATTGSQGNGSSSGSGSSSGPSGSSTPSGSSSGTGSSGTGGGPAIGSTSGSTPIILPTAPPAQVVNEAYVLELVSIAPAGGDTVRTTSWVVDGTPVASVFVGQRFGKHGELVVLALGTDGKGETVLLQVGDAAPRLIHVGEKGPVL